MLTPPDAGHSVWWTFTEDLCFAGWYVNLETRSVRWFGGTDHVDQALDLLVEPGRGWQWKDEDEFDEQCRHPELFWDAATAAGIKAHASHMISLIEQGRFPFDGSWCAYKPDPAWEPATLPWWWDSPGHLPPGLAHVDQGGLHPQR